MTSLSCCLFQKRRYIIFHRYIVHPETSRQEIWFQNEKEIRNTVVRKSKVEKLQILWAGCRDQDVSGLLPCLHLSSPPHLHELGLDGAPVGADRVCNLLAPPPPSLLPLPHLAQPGHLGRGALLLAHHLVQQPGSHPSASPLCLRPPLPPRLP